MADKAKDFIIISDDDNDHIDTYNSEDELTKGRTRSAKRRKLTRPAGSDAETSDNEQDDDENSKENFEEKEDTKDDESEEGEEDDDEAAEGEPKSTHDRVKLRGKTNTTTSPLSRPLTQKNRMASEAARKKSGVVYLSRVPPFMKPAKLRSLLTPYGTVGRIFLAPEDPAARARRLRAGGNRKRSFTEGWVEFVRRRDARAACDLLNTRPIGGPKRSYHHDDVWSLRYLRGFKWHHLTAQMAAEDAERASRLRADIARAARDNKEFVRNVEHAKRLDGMARTAATRKRKADEQGTAGDKEDGGEAGSSFGAQTPSLERGRKPATFEQVPLAKKGKDTDEQPERVTRVLSKIF